MIVMESVVNYILKDNSVKDLIVIYIYKWVCVSVLFFFE